MQKIALPLTLLAAAVLCAPATPVQAQLVTFGPADCLTQIHADGEPATLVAKSQEDSECDSFVGTWHRTDVSEACSSNLCITKMKTPGFLYVRIRAQNGGNEGLIEGKAIMQGVGRYIATMTFDDGKDNDNVLGTLTLSMGQRGIDVSYDGDIAALNLGMGVTVTGVYVKGKPNYIAAIDPLRSFRNAKNYQAAIKLVGEKNALNMRDVFNDGIVVVDTPGQYHGLVRGTGVELQVKTDHEGHMCILGRNLFPNRENKELVFYTNDKSVVNKIADVFEFVGDEREVLVIYKDVKP